MSAFLSSLEFVFGWLVAASWQASVLALAVVAIQRIFGARLNPRWRYALWLLVVLRLVLPVLPESALSLFQFAPPPPAALTVSVTEPLFVAAPELPPVHVPETVPHPLHSLSFYSLLAIVWLIGAMGLLILTLIVNHRFARQVANSPEVTDPELLRLFAEAKAEFRVRRAIRLVENSQVQSPAIMGLFQPALLLPVNVRQNFDARELRFIFLHELAHLKRGDVLIQALIAALQILHWFNPVLWLAFRRMRIDREPATDALVLSRTGEDEKERYGLMLIKLLEHFNQRHSLATLVGILEDKDQFKRRFSLIARFTRGAYGWSLLGVFLIAGLGIVGLTKARSGVVSTDKTYIEVLTRPGETTLEPVRSNIDGISSPPIYVWYTNVGIGSFGPVHRGSSLSDSSLVPVTRETLAVWCKSLSDHEATLEFIASKPAGLPHLLPNGLTAHPMTERRTEQVVPLGKIFSFRIFDAVNVTTSPSLDPTANDIETPIFQAIYSHDTARVKALLAKGAVVKSTDMEAALEVGPPAIAKLFWDAGDRHVSEMTYAIDQGATVADLEKLLVKGEQVERENDFTITPLGMAARAGNIEVAQWLLNNGARINSSREAPLLLAVKGESVEMVDFLLKNGAKADRDILAGSGSFGDPTLPGQMEKRVEMARLMIKAGALDHVDEPSKSGLLISACEQKNSALLQLYLDSGIDPLAKVRDGKTALEIVEAVYARREVDPAKEGMQPCIDMLAAAVKGAPMKPGSAESPPTGTNAAVAVIPAAFTTRLVWQLPQITGFDPTPGTHPDLDVKLLDLVRDGRTDKVGATDADQVLALLVQGASANVTDEKGNSALTWALNFGKDGAAQALIGAGANFRPVDANGENSAWLAAKIYYCPGALEAMIKYGANVGGLNKQGQTILVAMMHVRAAQAGKMNFLNDRVWTADEFKAYEARERRVIDLLIGARVDFNGKDGATTPLMAAAQGGHAEAVRTLVEHGANLTFKDANGHTALDLAKAFHPELVPLLDPGAGKVDVAKPGDAVVSGQIDVPAAANVDFAISTGFLISEEGARYPLSFDQNGKFSVTGVQPGRYRAVVHVVCEPRDVELTADKTFGFTEVTPGSHPVLNITWDPTPPAKGGIEIELKIVQLDEDVYQANKVKIDAGVAKGGAAIMGLLNQMKGVSLLSAPSVTTKPGQMANVDIVHEMPYPTQFENPKTTPFVAGTAPGALTNMTLYIPPTPRGFETKDIGVTAEITPSLIDKTLSPQGTVQPSQIMLSGKFTVAEFEGFTQSNMVVTNTPTFTTSESHFVEALADGELKGVWIPGSHFRTADALNKLPGVATDPNAPTIKTRYLLFLSAREVD